MRTVIILVLLLIVLLTGCAKECELKIHNDTPILQKAMIDGIVYELQSDGEPAVQEYFLNSYIITSETVKVEVEYLPNSPVSYVSPQKFKVEMKPGKDRSFHIVYDRGRLQIRNISSFTLDQILLKQADETEWSEDLYEGFLLPNEIDVIAVKAGTYSMKLIDAYGVEYPVEQIEIVAGEQLDYFFTGDL